MRHLTDGEREILREQERDYEPTGAELYDTEEHEGHMDGLAAMDDAYDADALAAWERTQAERLAALAEQDDAREYWGEAWRGDGIPADDFDNDDLPF